MSFLRRSYSLVIHTSQILSNQSKRTRGKCLFRTSCLTTPFNCYRRSHISNQAMSRSDKCIDDRDDNVLIDCNGLTGTIRLNRPKSLNALTLGMVRQVRARLKEWEDDVAVSCILLMGAGERLFCSGGDLKRITQSFLMGDSYTKDFFFEAFSLNFAIATYSKPIVSIMNGLTFGGAAGLTVIGQYCVATENAVFAMPECAVGLFPDVGSGYFLSRLKGNMGLFLGMTGHRLKGHDIVEVGLASHFIHSSQLSDFERDVHRLGAPVPPDDMRNLLQHYHTRSTDRLKGDNFPSFVGQHSEEVERCFQGASVEEIVKTLQEEGSEWAKNQLAAIAKMSPTSLKLTFCLLKDGLNRSLAQTLMYEYRGTQRCVSSHDFHEGIRAAVIDKDRNPHWKPSNLTDITQEMVDNYFSPLEGGRELLLEDRKGACKPRCYVFS